MKAAVYAGTRNVYEDMIPSMKSLLIHSDVNKVYFLIEDNRIDDIIKGNYKSKYNADSYLRTLLTLQRRCNFYLNFVERENMGKIIYEICKNCLDNKILK